MRKQILVKLAASLDQFTQRNDPRSRNASKQEITSIFQSCPVDDKKLLTEISMVFFEKVKQYSYVDWSEIQFVLFGRIILCVDFYIDTKEEALEYLAEGEIILRVVLTHLMKKYKISAEELRHAREQVSVN